MLLHGLRNAKPCLRRSILRKRRNFLALTLSLILLGLFPAVKYIQHGDIKLTARVSYDPLWSYPYVNASATAFPPHDPTYIVFEPPIFQPRGTYLDQPLQDTRRLLSHCRDGYFAEGAPCHAGPDPPLDVVWTWSNGSDRLFHKSLRAALTPTRSPRPHLFRDHDEIRHSIRSVLKHFSGSTTQLYIVTSDFSIPIPVMDGDDLINGTRRLGLVPRWLDPEAASEWRDGDVRLGMKYHSEIFPRGYGSSFNSYGIEAQLVNLQGVSENFIYMNDDFFMSSNLSRSDFYTSAYGVVLRMQADLLVKNKNEPKTYREGEWGPLEYTNWCLSNRFGSRRRPYVTHTAKAVSLSLLKEFSLMWDAELTVTASHAFRGMMTGHSDMYSLFLFSHSIVERWREGLLWSWAVAKLGGMHDEWLPADSERAWHDVGGQPGASVVEVMKTSRRTVREDVVSDNLRAAGHVLSGKTRYAFASGDGYPYDYRNNDGKLVWPSFMSSKEPLCTIRYSECFDRPGVHTASEFFKYVAFENLRCGDCIIHALRAASGTAGLSAFLPDAARILYRGEEDGGRSQSRSGDTGPPHLPLESDWRQCHFALQSVVQSNNIVNVREWTLQMLERYRFVIGQTSTLFYIIRSASDALIQLGRAKFEEDAALMCLNDNMDGFSPRAEKLLLDWQEGRWGRKAGWER
ncbi:hypothetical protein JB92DRAFT_2976612 [Gautieria morchelliformis]|nr:hypothetical protein JB92DRAFT_2976612 [Gautieria morchelliformis]